MELASVGAAVAVIARSAEQLEETVSKIEMAGGNAIAFSADVTDRLAVESVIQQIETDLGPVDLLINNAGALPPLGPLWEIDPDDWWRTMEINVRGAMLCARYVLPGMIARKRGRIINVASEAALGGLAYLSPYVASKTALIRLSETLALEAAPHGVSIFAICPGAVRTAMTDVRVSAEAQKWIPWCNEIFEKGQDVPPALAVKLVLRLASGQYDILSGRYMQVTDNLDEMRQRCREVRGKSLYTLRLPRLSRESAPDPTAMQAMLQQALQHHQANRFEQAEQSYLQVLAEQPAHPEALHRLGVLAQQRGHTQAAEQWWQQLIDAHPDSVNAWFSLANLRQAQGQLSAAEAAYRQATALKPSAAPIYNNLGYVLQQQGKLDEAIGCYQKCLELQPNCREAEANLGNTLYEQGKLSAEQQADYAALNLQVGKNRQKAGDVNTAAAYYQQAIALQPRLWQAHVSLGELLQAQGREEAAIAHYRQALENNPTDGEVYLKLGQLYQAQDQLTEAVAAYRQGLQLLNPHYASAVAVFPEQGDPPREIPVTPAIAQAQVTVGDYQFPAIPPVPNPDQPRPFWTVVITAYNRTGYLLEALVSVLRQWPGAVSMEILVMDNASTPPLFELVNALGGGIIRYYRNPQNLGPVGNSNVGIALSRGYWVHVLHDDDCVLPGFYARLQQSLEDCPDSVGVACTGFEYFNEKSETIGIGEVVSLYGEQRGIMQNWLPQIGVCGLVTIPAMVVRRSTHERLGGYYPDLPEIPDWEIFKRYASFYDWWYEPGILARYREHRQKETPVNWLSGSLAGAIRQAIEVSESYFPVEQRAEITAKARRHNFDYCLKRITIPLGAGNLSGAVRVLQEALKIDRSSQSVAKLFDWLTQPEAAPVRAAIVSKLFSVPMPETQKIPDERILPAYNN
jgi:NAD(P)-dependent dehydrogenase (short-subunit alcohol dehydrogenase family)/Tfp pilus assembly protein PilF/glycosyltransferase involved in cell wall biosynthesis